MACTVIEFVRRLFLPIENTESEPDVTRVNTLHLLIAELENVSQRIAALDLRTTNKDAAISDELFNFANDADEIAFVGRCAEALPIPQSSLLKMMTDLISDKNFYGQLCEFAVYDWLTRHDSEFEVQVSQSQTEVLNKNGTELDGVFLARDTYFDVKGFGFEAYVRNKFQKKLAGLVNQRRIIIDGPRDNSVKDIEGAFRKLSALASELQSNGIAKVPELDWTIRLPSQGTSFEEGTSNAYAAAEENWYYPFKTARQFHRNNAFVLIFAFSPQFNGLMSVNFGGSTEVFFRSLSRRAFLQTKGDTSPVSIYDPGADPAVTVDDASQLLSGIIFLNFSSDEAWMYLNPRAKHPLRSDAVPQLFDFVLPRELPTTITDGRVRSTKRAICSRISGLVGSLQSSSLWPETTSSMSWTGQTIPSCASV